VLSARRPTEKLYWNDPFATSFETSGARLGSFGDHRSLILDKTLFYAEAGGQLGDKGTLRVGGRTLAVTDVQIDDAEEIHHLVAGLDAIDPAELDLQGVIEGTVDAARRRDHMAQHTAQHMLSRALVDAAGAETVSARLGASTCTIDVSLAHVPDAALGRAEDLVNAAVMDDLVVRSLFPTPAELASMKLRREPKVAANVRIIDIGGFDLTPCGGTHCTRTGQIGSVVVVGTERYKGKLRVTFHAGARARQDARAKHAALATLAQDFTCGPLDVPAAVAKLRGDHKARLEALSATRGELVELLAREVLAAHPEGSGDDARGARIILRRDHDDIGMLRTLAGRLASRPDVVAFCAAPDPETGELAIVVQRGTASTFDCGAWLKATTARHGGRGGGRPARAEGRLPAGSDLASLARSA